MALTGIDLMVMWSPDLFGRAGFGEAAERIAAVLTGVAFCIATPVGMLTVDRFGRRPILLLGAAGQTVCMCLLGLLFWAGGGETVSNGGVGGWLAVGCVLGFIMSFGISWGIVAWIIPEELMPLHLRASAIGLCVVSNCAPRSCSLLSGILLVAALTMPPQGLPTTSRSRRGSRSRPASPRRAAASSTRPSTPSRCGSSGGGCRRRRGWRSRRWRRRRARAGPWVGGRACRWSRWRREANPSPLDRLDRAG